MAEAHAVAVAVAVAVAERLVHPETVLAAVPGPEGASLAHGLAGTALLHARLATLDPVFGAAADRHWAAAASYARRHRAAGAGIFATGGGLAASLIIGTGYLPDPAAWQAPASQAATWLSRQAQRIASDLGQRRRGGDPYARRAAYDVISGLAGIGRVLLAAITAGQPPAEPGLTAALQALATMIEAPHGSRPGWWLPASMHPPAVKVAPSGSAATGMAHGIAGPLAFLAAAQARGWAVPGQDAAIRRASQWLLDWKAAGTYRWPASISGAELDTGAARLTGRQDAWCYGTPGISAALALASQALGDDSLAQAGQAAIDSLASRPARTWDVDGPTLCHGHAGVLQSAAIRQPDVASGAARAITTAFDASRQFAIPHTDNGVIEDRPGFLTGAASPSPSTAICPAPRCPHSGTASSCCHDRRPARVPSVRARLVARGAILGARRARSLSRVDTDTVTATQLRNSMADGLRGWDGEPLPRSVDAAVRAVPREAFLPGTPLAEAYGDSPVVTHRDTDGVATSSASAPGIVAAMLAQLDVRLGQRILEIGAGTGYNAALLAHLTGPSGHVTTVELDPGIAAEAEAALAAAGHPQVTVIAGDGEYGHAPNSPYDRIIVTVGAWELPSAWADQLAPGGLLVVPLRMRGLTRSVTFEHAAGIWRSRALYECGFMPIRGAGAVAERNIPLGDTGITIRIDDGRLADADALQQAIASTPAQAWTGIEVTVTGELDFWLAGQDGFFRLLAGTDAAQRAGLVPPAFNWGAMGLLTGDSFAYLTRRPGRPGRSELGACGYGPAREQLTSTYADRIRAFHRDRAQAGRLQIEVHPAAHALVPDALMQIDKRSTRVIVRAEVP